MIAHEIGHHVQNQLGTMRKFDQAAARMDARQRNALSVRLELQADCYAGVWGYFAAKRNLLDAGDVEEGLRAAAAVGDDAIQQNAKGYVVPDAFTHGRAEQRARWFKTGPDHRRSAQLQHLRRQGRVASAGNDAVPLKGDRQRSAPEFSAWPARRRPGSARGARRGRTRLPPPA